MATFGISHTDVMDSVWYVVHAVNTTSEFKIEYPSSEVKQARIAAGFERASEVGFRNCAGAIDGVLIWMQKPTLKETKRVGVDQAKFLCGRKSKFGLNCQAVSDVNGKILDISIACGGSAADCVAFETSDLYERLSNGLLKKGRVLFGDNAYLNSLFMVTPYTNVAGNPNKKSEDNYNFFHSQLRIRVECTFGMLAARWGCLRMALSRNITVTKVIALVNTLARLHNFCLEANRATEEGAELNIDRGVIPDQLDIDRQFMMNSDDGFVRMCASNDHSGSMPMDLMDHCGHHFNEVPRAIRHHHDRARTKLHDHVYSMHACRPLTNVIAKHKTK